MQMPEGPTPRRIAAGGNEERVKGGGILGHGVSKFRGNVRLSVQQKCHSVKPRWYQMMTFRKPRGIVALADPQRPCIS